MESITKFSLRVDRPDGHYYTVYLDAETYDQAMEEVENHLDIHDGCELRLMETVYKRVVTTPHLISTGD